MKGICDVAAQAVGEGGRAWGLATRENVYATDFPCAAKSSNTAIGESAARSIMGLKHAGRLRRPLGVSHVAGRGVGWGGEGVE